MNREYWDLMFSVEVSAMYHDWRRSALGTIVLIVRAVTFIAAIVTLLSLGLLQPGLAATIIAAVSGVSAIVALTDLVANFSEKAQTHETLFRRFKELQAKIEQYRDDPGPHLAELNAETERIRVDEPSTLWAIYARAWNQIIDRHAIEKRGYYRKVSWWRNFLRHVFSFNPQDFPAIQDA